VEDLGADRTPSAFFGAYHHRVDDKGRVAVPAQLRRWLPEGSVVAPGPDRRLMIWPPSEWKRQEELYRRTAETPAQARRFLRRLAGSTYPLELDAQGRLLLNAAQRAWAQLDDSAVFVGLGDVVEIASDHNWSADGGELDPDAFTRTHDLVIQRGTAASEQSS
jgi:transcriptional regulator MraZ